MTVQTEPMVTSVLPRVQLTIEERKMPLIMNQMQEPSKTSSRLKYENRVRKKVKVVGLSDLPPLPDKDFDVEIDSTSITRPTSIKTR